MKTRAGFNMLAKLHSIQGVQVRRPGNPILYSPATISPSNYFRQNQTLENMVITGREYVVPVDSLLGTFSKVMNFSSVPVDGEFKLEYLTNQTTVLNTLSTMDEIQIALRLVAGLEKVLVSGSFATEILFVLPGFSTLPAAITLADSDLVDAALNNVSADNIDTYEQWDVPLRRGDKMQVPRIGLLTIETAQELYDIGAVLMGYRVTCE